jgi:cell division protein FtsW
MMNIDYHILRKIAVPALVLSVLLLLLVFIPGIGSSFLGGNRWINVAGFVFQPSELVKLTFIIYLSSWLIAQKERRQVQDHHTMVQFLVLVAVITGLVVLQPDMGTMSIIAIISLIIYFTSGARMKYIATLIGSGISFFLLLILVAPYRAGRLTIFLHPGTDVRGLGYHIQQSLIAIGSGGFFGVGFGKSRQKFNYLPESATDSIYAVIAEELGFIFAMAIIATFIFLFIRGLRIARNSPDDFGKLLVTGIMSWLSVQALMNIAALSSLIPLTGIPLPFFSYGGSSLIITLAAVGVVLNVSRQSKR